jgi:hypothetical protein
MEAAAAASPGSDPGQLPEPEARLLVEAERQAELLRQKEALLKKRHLDDINSFLLVRLLPPALPLQFLLVNSVTLNPQFLPEL